MFRYIVFTRVTDDITTYEFRGRNEDVKVNHFDVNVVSIESDDEIAITELIISQNEKINCKEINKDEFKNLVKDSAQLNRIRSIVKERIASKYSIADEIALLKKDHNDSKKIEYEAFVNESIQKGDELKALIGY